MAASNIIDELLILIGIDPDEKSFDTAKKRADEIEQSFDSMAKNVTASVGLMYGAIALWVNQFADSANEVSKLARRVNSTVEDIQELDYVAERSGLSIEFMRKATEKLQAKAAQAAGGNKDLAQTFKELGINAASFNKLSAADRVETLADAFQKIQDPAKRGVYALKLFEEEGIAIQTAFEGGAEGVQKLREQARKMGLFSKEDAERAEEFKGSVVDTRRALESVRNEVAAALLPDLIDLLKAFKEFFLQNRELISQGVVKLFQALSVAVKALAAASLLFITYRLGSVILATVGAMRKLTWQSALATASVIALPLLVGAAFVAIGLIAQDLYGYLTGMDSAIGDLVKTFPALDIAIKSTQKAFDLLFATVEGVYNIIAGLFTLDSGQLVRGVNKLRESFDETTTSGGKVLGPVGKFLFEPTDFALLPKLFNMGANAPGTGAGVAAAGIIPKSVGPGASTTYNDNRNVQVNGADIGEVKKVIGKDRAYTAGATDSGMEY